MSIEAPSTSMDTTTRPRIFFLSLDKQPFFDDMYAHLIDAIASKATIQRASQRTSALTYLSTNTPTAIIITDPGITKAAHSAVLEKVISYVRSGGIAIFAGHFSGFIRPTDLDRHFRSPWNLPWQFGDYHRTTVYLNQRVQQVSKLALPAEYSQKAVFLKNVAPDAALYLPSMDSVTESHVFPSEPVKNREQTPVAFTAVEEGWLGYVGDVNAETESDAVILAMCGL
jgi:hypothetical protein